MKGKNIFRIVFMLFLSGLLIMSCSKKDDPKPDEPSTENPGNQGNGDKNPTQGGDNGNTSQGGSNNNTDNPTQGGSNNNTDNPTQGGDNGNTDTPTQGGDSGNTDTPTQGGDSGNTDTPTQGGDSGNTDNPTQGGDSGNTDNPSQGGGNDTPGTDPSEPGKDDPTTPGKDPETPEAKTFVVTYDVDGGIVDGETSQKVKEGESLKLSAGPMTDKPDYRFDGWKDASGKSYKAGESVVVNADITLSAIWTFEPKLIFDGNGYSGKLPDAFKFVDGLATVPAASLVWDGYEFLGWALDRDTRSAEFKAGDKVQTNDKSVVLYAVWKSQKYVYTFYSHYGSTFKTEQPFSAKDIANGNALFDIMLTGDYEGYSHVGWRDVVSKKEYKLTDVFDELESRTFEPILISRSGAQMESWIINKY